jgi:hypothetical protein
MSEKYILVWSDDQYSEILLKDLIKQHSDGCQIKILYFLYDVSKSSIEYINKLINKLNGGNLCLTSCCCELNYSSNNFIKLAIGINIADDIDFGKVAFAVHKEDCYGSPQDRMLFLISLNNAAGIGTKNNVGIYTPYIDMTAAEIYEKIENND